VESEEEEEEEEEEESDRRSEVREYRPFAVLTGGDVDAHGVVAQGVEHGAVDGEVGGGHHGDLVGDPPVDVGTLVDLSGRQRRRTLSPLGFCAVLSHTVC